MQQIRAGVLHGAGYAGGELIRLLLNHPFVQIASVTSRSFAGQPVWAAHPALRGQTDLQFSEEPGEIDVALIAAEHGQAARAVNELIQSGFEGAIVDLSADFRFDSPEVYRNWFGMEHAAAHLLGSFQYGLPEIRGPYPGGTTRIANPGCFATGIALALHPVVAKLGEVDVAVTALTGASGAGVTPRPTTHFPNRDGNVRAYKVLEHQHTPEVGLVLGGARVHFVPSSGPWVRGIWGTAQVGLPANTDAADVYGWFEDAYGDAPAVRLWPGELPELRAVVGTPFCDIGFVVGDGQLVIGFALDNLLKGAASQAVQNLNLILGLPEMAGLVPMRTAEVLL